MKFKDGKTISAYVRSKLHSSYITFQGSLTLEDFHTKALRLVAQAGYTGATKDKVLRDNIISGLTSDKI